MLIRSVDVEKLVWIYYQVQTRNSTGMEHKNGDIVDQTAPGPSVHEKWAIIHGFVMGHRVTKHDVSAGMRSVKVDPQLTRGASASSICDGPGDPPAWFKGALVLISPGRA
jgi:hypothetical protein